MGDVNMESDCEDELMSNVPNDSESASNADDNAYTAAESWFIKS